MIAALLMVQTVFAVSTSLYLFVAAHIAQGL